MNCQKCQNCQRIQIEIADLYRACNLDFLAMPAILAIAIPPFLCVSKGF